MLAAWRFATGVRPAPLSPRVKSRMQSRFVHTHKASLRVTSAAPAGTSAGREDPGGEGKQGTITEWTLQTISSQHLHGQEHPSECSECFGESAAGDQGLWSCLGCPWGSGQLLLWASNCPERTFTSLLLDWYLYRSGGHCEETFELWGLKVKMWDVC